MYSRAMRNAKKHCCSRPVGVAASLVVERLGGRIGGGVEVTG